MSNGIKSAIKQNIGEINEAVVIPVKDEIGKALEEGVQSVVGIQSKPSDPLAQQKKQEEELKKKQWALQTIQHYREIEEEQKKIREQEKQKKLQEQKEEEEKKKVKQYEIMEKRKQQLPRQVAEAQRKTEIKRGVGG